MTRILKTVFYVFFFLLIILPFPVRAEQNPQEQLKQLMADIQKNPGDYALREKIIKHVQIMEPRPQVPQEAKRPFMKGVTFQKEASSVSDYELAISAYKEALLLAPWWPEAIYNMALAQEGAGKFDDAIQSIKLYLLTGPKDAEQAENRIYVMEAKKEKATADITRKEKEKYITTRNRFVGIWKDTNPYRGVDFNIVIRQDDNGNLVFSSNPYVRELRVNGNKIFIKWRHGQSVNVDATFDGSLSDDEKFLEGTYHWYDDTERRWTDNLVRAQRQ